MNNEPLIYPHLCGSSTCLSISEVSGFTEILVRSHQFTLCLTEGLAEASSFLAYRALTLVKWVPNGNRPRGESYLCYSFPAPAVVPPKNPEGVASAQSNGLLLHRSRKIGSLISTCTNRVRTQ